MTKTAAKKAKLAAKAAAVAAPKAPAAKPVKKAVTVAPKKSSNASASAKLSAEIAKILDTNKAEEITTLNLKELCSFADYMIVASGRAPRHVVALADHVGDMLKKAGNPPLSIEGKETGDWVLIDAGDVIVHIFRPEIRQFYNLEKMWTMPTPTAP